VKFCVSLKLRTQIQSCESAAIFVNALRVCIGEQLDVALWHRRYDGDSPEMLYRVYRGTLTHLGILS